MIPLAYLQAWRAMAPWPDLRQVEQDLVICRALCDLFRSSQLAGSLAFRGGTAIHKLLLRKPLRYSEDIDLVQIRAEPIGTTVNAVREALSWLGDCQRERAEHSIRLVFPFEPGAGGGAKLKLKVEINTREHAPILGFETYPFSVASPWFSGEANLVSYAAEELFATKLRAFLQRRKGRDLFDLHLGLSQLALDPGKVVACFERYMEQDQKPIRQAEAQKRMLQKLNRNLVEDILPLLPAGVSFTESEALRAFEVIWFDLISQVSGEPWKSTASAIGELRATRYPDLLSGYSGLVSR